MLGLNFFFKVYLIVSGRTRLDGKYLLVEYKKNYDKLTILKLMRKY